MDIFVVFGPTHGPGSGDRGQMAPLSRMDGGAVLSCVSSEGLSLLFSFGGFSAFVRPASSPFHELRNLLFFLSFFTTNCQRRSTIPLSGEEAHHQQFRHLGVREAHLAPG